MKSEDERAVQFPVTWTVAPKGGLVESVERIVVEALGQAIASQTRCPANEPDSEVVTRDIINAIADKLEGDSCPWDAKRSAGWLRSQAKGGTDD